MKLKRLEVRLREKVPAERELIDALDQRDGQYGGRNELMRECIQRGFAVMLKKMEELEAASGTGNEMATLDALARAFDNEYGYRVVKTFLEASRARQTGARSDAPPPVPPVAAEPAAKPSEAAPLPQAAGSSAVPSDQSSQEEAQEEAADTATEEKESPKRRNWSSMRGLAGTGE